MCSNFNFTLVDSKVGDFTMKTMLLLDTFSLNIYCRSSDAVYLQMIFLKGTVPSSTGNF